MGLNPQQLAAVKHTDTPLLVLAGAGSGKTGVITQKIAYLINEKGYSPRSIVAVTFTNKASLEMRTRLRKQLDARILRQLSISTFHRLGLTILHQDGATLGLRKGFTILDQSDALSALREILKEQNSAIEERVAQQQISRWKNDMLSPDAALASADGEQLRIAALLYAEYTHLLRACNSVDFDDLIGLAVTLLQNHRENSSTLARSGTASVSG